MSDEDTLGPPKQGELFTPTRVDKPASRRKAEPKARSQRTPKAAPPPQVGPDPSPEPKLKRERSARPKKAAQRLADLRLPEPSAMSEAQLIEDIAWLKARTRHLEFQLRSRRAAAASGIKRTEGQLSAEAVRQAIERHGGGYGAKGLAARELNISERTLYRRLKKP